MKNYTLRIPEDIEAELERIATERGTTTQRLVQKAIAVLLIIERLEADPERSLIIRDSRGDTEVVL